MDRSRIQTGKVSIRASPQPCIERFACDVAVSRLFSTSYGRLLSHRRLHRLQDGVSIDEAACA